MDIRIPFLESLTSRLQSVKTKEEWIYIPFSIATDLYEIFATEYTHWNHILVRDYGVFIIGFKVEPKHKEQIRDILVAFPETSEQFIPVLPIRKNATKIGSVYIIGENQNECSRKHSELDKSHHRAFSTCKTQE